MSVAVVTTPLTSLPRCRRQARRRAAEASHRKLPEAEMDAQTETTGGGETDGKVADTKAAEMDTDGGGGGDDAVDDSLDDTTVQIELVMT